MLGGGALEVVGPLQNSILYGSCRLVPTVSEDSGCYPMSFFRPLRRKDSFDWRAPR